MLVGFGDICLNFMEKLRRDDQAQNCHQPFGIGVSYGRRSVPGQITKGDLFLGIFLLVCPILNASGT
jgi:hypothetical protein